jgi:predicted RNA-binding Zn-ribbon protein involved in translation (DUF1610 family)
VASVLLKCPACKKRISSSAHSCPHCGEPLSDEWGEKGRRSQERRQAGCGFLLLLFIGFVAFVIYQSPDKTDAPKQMDAREQSNTLKRDETDNPERYLKIESFSWSKGGFDTVMIANFSIRNTLPWAVKDLKIRCRHSAPSGTVVDENTRVIYEIFGANQTRELANISMGFIHNQVSTSSCTIIGAVSIR